MRVEHRLMLFVLLVLTGMFGACSDDDNPVAATNLSTDPALVPGTWDLTGMTSSTGGRTYTVPDDEIMADPLEYLFVADGNGTMAYQSSVSAFSWSVEGSTMTAYGTGFSNTYKFGVSSERLTLAFDVEDSGVTFHITHIFTRRAS